MLLSASMLQAAGTACQRIWEELKISIGLFLILSIYSGFYVVLQNFMVSVFKYILFISTVIDGLIFLFSYLFYNLYCFCYISLS